MEEKLKNLFIELFLDSKQSDRCLAKKINVSQPTVSKLRKKLDNEDYVSEYTLIPNLSKIDVQLISFIGIKWKDYKNIQDLKRFESIVQDNDLVFFAAPGEGFQDKTKMLISFHKDYKSYEEFLRELRADFAEVIDAMDTFLISTDNILKNFTFN